MEFAKLCSRLSILTALGLIACQPQQAIELENNSGTVLAAEQNPIFANLPSDLQGQTKVPLLLPAFVPESSNPLATSIVEDIRASGYEILLAFDENCTGGNACRLGRITGSTLRGQPPLEGKEVTLADGAVGYFVDSNCGANCSDVALTWVERDSLYKLEIKGTLEDLEKMANSMTELN